MMPAKGNYHGGTSGIRIIDDGVGLVDGQLTEEVKGKLLSIKAIIDGKQEVPAKPLMRFNRFKREVIG